MEEETKQVEDTAREPHPERKHNCIINIFCGEKKHDGKWDGGKERNGNCIINIFCNEKKHDGKWDGGKDHDGSCIINIFCNDKKHEDECDDNHMPAPMGW